jgi:GAF domain-containing protein
MGAERGNLQLYDAATGGLTFAAQHGFSRPFLDFFEKNVCSDRGSACGAALVRGERVVVEDVEESELFLGTPAAEVMLDARARAVQSTPLVSRRGRILGVLSTHHERPRVPTARELRRLDELARLAAGWLGAVAPLLPAR